MKKPILLVTLLCFIVSALFPGCKKSDTTPVPAPDPCLAGSTVLPVAGKTHTVTGQSLGTITVTSPIGSGYVYSIGGAFQGSTNFFNLPQVIIRLLQKMLRAVPPVSQLLLTGMEPNFLQYALS